MADRVKKSSEQLRLDIVVLISVPFLKRISLSANGNFGQVLPRGPEEGEAVQHFFLEFLQV